MPVARLLPGASGLMEVVCNPGNSVGDAVYISGPRVGNLYQVDKADITDPMKIPAVGLIVSKRSPTEASVRWEGPIEGIFTGLVPRRVYYLNTSGTIDLVVPAPGLGQSLYVQRLGVALAADVLLVKAETFLTKLVN